MLGRIVKYHQKRKEAYKAIGDILHEIIDADVELRKATTAAFDEDGLIVRIGDDPKSYKKICGQIAVICDEANNELANRFERAIFERKEDGSLEKTTLGHKLIDLLDFLKDEMKPTHISILNNLVEIGNEFELIDAADRLELNINLGKEHRITTSVDDVEINLNYNSGTTDSELARSIMKIYFGKTRS